MEHCMSVKQQQLTKPRRGLAAPLNREHLDRAGPWLRLMAGLALIAYTSYTTITGIGDDFAPLLKGSLYGVISVQLAAGVAAALLISLVEWLTSEQYRLIYIAFLIIDARYTQRQIGPGVAALSQYHLKGLDSVIPVVVSFVASWGVSLLAARYGEILLFGKRKRPKKNEEE
jgi:hypothetical protein